MTIHYTMAIEGDLLLVRTSGCDESLSEVEEYGVAVVRACLQHGVTRVLCIELDLEYRLDTVDTYRAAEFMSTQVPALAKAAIVCNPRCLADARFWEDVAVNRGLTVRVFTDTETARRWLDSVNS